MPKTPQVTYRTRYDANGDQPRNEVWYYLEFQYLDVEGQSDAECYEMFSKKVERWWAIEEARKIIEEIVKHNVSRLIAQQSAYPNMEMGFVDGRLVPQNAFGGDASICPFSIKIKTRFYFNEEHTSWKLIGDRVKVDKKEVFEAEFK